MAIRVQFQGLISHIVDDNAPVAVFLRGSARKPHFPKIVINQNSIVGNPTFAPWDINELDGTNTYLIHGYVVSIAGAKENLAKDDITGAVNAHVPHLKTLSGSSGLSDGVRRRDVAAASFSGFLERPHGAWAVRNYFAKKGYFDNEPRTLLCFPSLVELTLYPAVDGEPIVFTTNYANPIAGLSLFVEDGATVLITNECEGAEASQDFYAHYAVLRQANKQPVPIESEEDCDYACPSATYGGPVLGVQCSNTQYP